jgi:hypothetical protein
MFNNRIIIAQKELFISIFKSVGKDYNNYKEIINNYSSIFKPIAAWMLARDSDEFAINDIVSHLTEYINIKKLNPANIKVNKIAVVINDNSFDDLNDFTNFVHGNFPVVRQQVVQKRDENFEQIPVLTGDGIKIYKVEQAQDSKELAADTSWCIAYKGPSNMWQSYRNNQAATFFIVWDENPPTPNQRKVALQYNQNNVLITDIPNLTGPTLSNDISFEYNGQTITGKDIPTYLTYLKSKGVNIDATIKNPKTGKKEKILKNKPVTPEEKLLNDLSRFAKFFNNSPEESPFTEDDIKLWSTGKFELKLKQREGETAYFIEDGGVYKSYLNGNIYAARIEIPKEIIIEKTPLIQSPDKELLSSITLQTEDAKTYLSKFIGTGWMMPDNIFNYVFETPGGNDILVQYVNTGLPIPKTQTDRISKNRQLLNSYIKQQLAGVEQGFNSNFAFLEYIDTNNQEVKDLVLQRTSKGYNVENFPEKWARALPQIGLKNARPNDEIDFGDDFVNKLAIIKGIISVYKKYPTLENTRLLLHVPEAITPILGRARKQKYELDMFEHIDDIKKWSRLWSLVPEEFKNLPEFILYKATDRKNKIKSGDVGNLEQIQPGSTLDNLTNLIALMDDGDVDPKLIANKINNIDFWKSAIENFKTVKKNIFRNIHLMHEEEKDDDDDEDEDMGIIREPEFQKDTYLQHSHLTKFLKLIPSELLYSEEFKNLIKTSGSKQLFNDIFKTRLQSSDQINMLGVYIKDLKELLDSNLYISDMLTRPNTFIVNLIENNNDQNLLYRLLDKANNNFWSSTNFEKFISWYPEILNKLSDQTLLKVLSATGQMGYNMPDIIKNLKPNFYNEWFPYLSRSIRHQQENPELYQNLSKEKWDQIRQISLDRDEEQSRRFRIKFNEIPEYDFDRSYPEIDDEEIKEIEEKDKEEEPVVASSKLMVKIAQKLDLKKKYRLADKLTYILRKKI